MFSGYCLKRGIMGEIRKDYFLDRYVIISPERAKRPHDFQVHPMEHVKSTPFTPGNEHQLPMDEHQQPIILHEYPQGPDWRLRVVPNLFAITRPEGQAQLLTNDLYTWANNYGYHEIVIEGQQDNRPFADLGPELIAEAIRIAIDRVKLMQAKQNIEYVAYFKNERPEAGASISHPHSQVIATAIIPPFITRLTQAFSQLRKQYGFSPLYKVLDYERGGPRIIAETKYFSMLCPYASRFPFEVMIMPLRESNTYTALTNEELADLAGLLHKVLAKLATMAAPYNIQWVHNPKDKEFHWYITVAPRLNVWAGFEFETGIIVNPVPPENAALFYR